MVLDLCPEFYVGSKENLENLVWQPEAEEHQRRRWLAPKVEVAAPKLVPNKVPNAVPAFVSVSAPTVPTVAPSSERAHRKTTMAPCTISQTSRGPEISQTCGRSCHRRFPPSCNSPSPSCVGSGPEPLPGVPTHNPPSCRVHEGSPATGPSGHHSGCAARRVHAGAGDPATTASLPHSRDVLPRRISAHCALLRVR